LPGGIVGVGQAVYPGVAAGQGLQAVVVGGEEEKKDAGLPARAGI
jgi:hypothetical protein